MSSLNVLLVDDEEEFVTTLAERLALRGFYPEIAMEGESALQQIDSRTFDVIVLDIMMPGIGGIEVLQQIRQRRIETPVILLTGHGSTREGMEGMRHGAFDYLMKPLNIDELIAKMQEAAGGRAGK